jgi:predicted permease
VLPPRVRRALRIPLGRKSHVETETDDEIRFHIAMRTEDLVASGMSRDAAEAEALKKFGQLEAVRPQLLAAAKHREETLSMFQRFDAVRDDVRYAFRQLRRAPGFSAALAVTFALGIGANATMFEILDRLLFRPPAFMADAGRVGHIYLRRLRGDGTERVEAGMSYLRYAEMRDKTRAFAKTAAITEDHDEIIGTGTEAEAVNIGMVSASFWALFDARPALGRYFTPDEDRVPGTTKVTVLGYGYWQSRFGGDRNVLGKQVRIAGHQYTIIGVAPNGFQGTWATTTAAYIPITAGGVEILGTEDYYRDHGATWLEMIARLAPGVEPEEASAQLTNAYRESRRKDAAQNHDGQKVEAKEMALTRGEFAPLQIDRGPRRSASAKVAVWLGGVAVVVLLIACANVANLLIARGLKRRREIAVRVALGVGRSRLVAHLLTESVLVATLGGALGLAVAHFGGGVLRRNLLPDVDWSLVPTFDARVLAFTAVAALFTGVLTGLAPAAHALRADVNSSLKSGERGAAPRARIRTLLLVGQAALSVVLLVGASLFVRSLHNVQSIHYGWDPEHTLNVRLDLRGVDLTPAEEEALTERVVQRAKAMPGVLNASTMFSIPFWRSWTDDVFVPGMDSSDHQKTFIVNPVGDEFFPTMGTRILRGRAVSSRDLPNGPKVAVVSEAMGKLLWKGRDPIGQCFRLSADTAPCLEVVGIAENQVFGDLEDDDGLQLYLAVKQALAMGPPGRGLGGVVVRTAGDPRRMMEPLHRDVQQLMPGMGYAQVRPLATGLTSAVRQWTLGATMFTVFGALALVLAAVGLYGVIAYDVAQRTRELGLRVALGAQSARISRLVLWQGLRVTMAGVAVGLVIAFVAVRYVEKLLFNTAARDPLAFGVATVTILVVAVIATWVPARRATRVDPVVALRSD